MDFRAKVTTLLYNKINIVKLSMCVQSHDTVTEVLNTRGRTARRPSYYCIVVPLYCCL